MTLEHCSPVHLGNSVSYTAAGQEAMESAFRANDHNRAQSVIESLSKRQLIVICGCLDCDCLLWLIHMIVNQNFTELANR